MNCCKNFKWKRLVLPQRWIFGIMGSLAVVLAYTMRGALSIAIIQMVVPNPNKNPNSKNQTVCGIGNYSAHLTDILKQQNVGQFDWSQEQQGFVLSAFYYGYIVTHIPGSLLAEKFGGKWTLSLGILSTGVFTLLTPVVTQWGEFPALMCLRVLIGLGEGTTFPALAVLVAAWAPPAERSRIGSLVFGGVSVGNVLTYFVSGFILEYFSWHEVFYFWGSISIAWFILFTILCYSDPESHPFISREELDYLESEMGQLKRKEDLPPTPWMDIIKSLPMIAIVVGHIGHDWILFMMAADLPKYMSGVIGFSIVETGLYTSLTFVGQWFITTVTSVVCDFLTKREIISIGFARKLFTAIAAFGPGIFILGASYSECDRPWVVTCFVFGMACLGTYYSGIRINTFDLSPNYAGSLTGVVNGLGAIAGMVSPSLVGLMTKESTIEEWRLVFWITLVILIITTGFYMIWGSGDVQLWNYPKESNYTEDGSKETVDRENIDGMKQINS